MAGPYYVRSSDGNDGDNGLSWINAKATFGAAVALAAAGERIYVDDDHQETLVADTTYTFAGTEGVPVEVFVVTTDTTDAVSNYNSVTQWIEGSTNGKHIIIAGEVYFWGIYLVWGDGNGEFISNSKTVVFEKSKIKLDEITGDYFGISSDNTIFRLLNTDIEFSDPQAHFKVGFPSSFIWHGGTLTGDQDRLIHVDARGPYIEIIGVDLSSIDGGTIIDVVSTSERFFAYLSGIKLHATNEPTLIDEGPERNAIIHMDMFDQSDQNALYRFRREFQYGHVQDETTLIVSGKGLYDGTNEFSVEMVSRAAPTPTFYDPFRYELPAKRVTGLASGKTFTVYILKNGNGGQPAALNDDEVWLEVAYPDNTTAQYNIQTDKKASPTIAAAAQTDDAGRWTGETNGREQKLEVTVASSAGKAGPCRFWVCLANSNETIYVCPEVIVS